MNGLFKKITTRKDLLLLFLIWVFVQCFLIYINGIKVDGEAGRIIREANNLVELGHFSAPNFYMYLTEISLVYLHLKSGLSLWVIILIQLLVNLLALFYFYQFLLTYYTSKKQALAACFLLIICYPYQVYNTFLYTESLFFSISLFYSIYLLKIKHFTIKSFITLSFLLLLLCVTRPTGIFFLGATIIYLFFRLSQKIPPVKRVIIFVALSGAALFILNILMGSGGGIDILLPFRDERIICEVPTIPYEVKIKTSADGNSLYGLFYYITHNFDQFFRLALLKSKAFFGLTRPYYSFAHNIFIVTFFYPLYIFILFGLGRFKRETPLSFIYFITLILITWLSVVFSCDEWHNRFFLTLTPFIITPALFLFNKKPNTK